MQDNGKPLTIKIGDAQYEVTPLGRSQIMELREIYEKVRPDPIGVISSRLSGLTELQQRVLLERAYDSLMHGPSSEEMQRWIDSSDGSAYIMWILLRDNNPSIDSHVRGGELLDELVSGMGREGMQRWLDYRDTLMDETVAQGV